MGGKTFFVLGVEGSAAKICPRGGGVSKYIIFWGCRGQACYSGKRVEGRVEGGGNTAKLCLEHGGSTEKYVWRVEET